MRISAEKFKLNKKEILKYLSYKSIDIDLKTEKAINKSIKKIKKIANCKYTYNSFDFEIKDKRVKILNSNIYFESEDLAHHLKDSKKMIVFSATLGDEVDKYVKKLSLFDMSETVIFDAVATTLVEELSDEACNEIIIEVGLNKNFRFSPGYGDLDLNEQSKILNLIDATKAIGVRLSDTNMLIPSKSITAIFGLFAGKGKTKKSCKYCNLKENCAFLKAGKVCYAR